MKKKLFKIITIILFLSIILIGCKKKKAAGDSLTVLAGISGLPLENEKRVLARYTELTGQEFEIIAVPYEDLEKKLSTMLRGGEPPVLFRGTEIHTVKYRDQFVPLEYDDSTLIPRIFYNSRGEKISLPVEITAVGCFINTDLADKYGVKYPKTPDEVWTWEEFEIEMRKLVGKEDVDFPAVIDGSAHRFSPWIYQHGGKLYNGSFKDLGWDEPPAIAALERMMRLEKEGIFDPQTYSIKTAGDGLFTSGRYGVHFAGSWMVQRYKKNLNFNFTTTYMPRGKGSRATVIGGSNYQVVKNSGQEEAGLKFIAWLSQLENLAMMGQMIGQLTAVTTIEIDYGDLTPYFAAFSRELAATPREYIDDFAQYIRVPGAFSYSKDAIIEALGGLKTAKQALKDATVLLEESAANAGLND